MGRSRPVGTVLPILGFRSGLQPFVSNGLMGLPGDLEDHEHILTLEMWVLSEDIVHAETSIYELEEQVHWNPGALYDGLSAENPSVRLYSQGRAITALASIGALINRVDSAKPPSSHPER